jgi:hypothetical protein
MARARQFEEWDKVAWVCLHQPRWSRKRYRLIDFQPLRKAARRGQADIGKVDKIVASKLLPDELTNKEIDALWEKRKVKADAGRK